MTNEKRYRLRQLCMAWTKNKARADAFNESEMAFLAMDALDEMENPGSKSRESGRKTAKKAEIGMKALSLQLPAGNGRV